MSSVQLTRRARSIHSSCSQASTPWVQQLRLRPTQVSLSARSIDARQNEQRTSGTAQLPAAPGIETQPKICILRETAVAQVLELAALVELVQIERQGSVAEIPAFGCAT